MLSNIYKEKIDDYILKYLINISENHNDKNEFMHEVSLLTEADTLDKKSGKNNINDLTLFKGAGI